MSDVDTKCCECPRCASASSPVGYLLALLQFVKDYFGKDINYLFKERMSRPQLTTSPTKCPLIDDPVPQISIAIGVLLEYIGRKRGMVIADHAGNANVLPLLVYEELKNSLNPRPFMYEGTRFREYLTILGTSLAEIHATFTDPDVATIKEERLAEFLGISFKEFTTIKSQQNFATAAELLGVSEADINNALINSDADKVKKFLNINNDELDDLLHQALVNANDREHLNYGKFDVMRRIVAFTRVLGITSEDMIALLGVTNAPSLDGELIERIYLSSQAGNSLGLSGVEIGALLMAKTDAQLINAMGLDNQAALDSLKGGADPSPDELAGAFQIEIPDIQALLTFIGKERDELATADLNDLYRLSTFAKLLKMQPRALVGLMAGMNPPIGGLDSLESLVPAWRRIQDMLSRWSEIENFYLVKVAFDQDQLAAYLGVDKTELDKICNNPNDDSLASLFGISAEELAVLYEMGIKEGATNLDKAIAISSLNRLELLHRPLRLDGFLEINVGELKDITSTLNLPNGDMNEITYDQIVEARWIVFLCRLLGLDIAQTTRLIKSLSAPADLAELKDALNFTDEEWDEYLPLNDDEKRMILADKLGMTVADLAETSDYLHSDLGSQSDVDVLRRIAGIARQIGFLPQELCLLLATLPGNLAVTDIDSFIHMFGLCATPLALADILAEVKELNNDFANIDSYGRAYWIYRLNAKAAGVGLKIKTVAGLNKWEQDVQAGDVDGLLALAGQFFDEEQLEEERRKPDERIWLKTREALIRYALSPKVTPADPPWTLATLSDHLLIDLEYSPEDATTEIQQAIESVQTYIVRAQTGQEDGIPALDEPTKKQMEEEWRWVQKYVLWEAAQKVFWYPEDYVMPQLRDDKSPFFKELEDELSQGEVTSSLAEKAISNYLEKLHAISALRVSGTVYDEENKKLYIFARSQLNEKETLSYFGKRDVMVAAGEARCGNQRGPGVPVYCP